MKKNKSSKLLEKIALEDFGRSDIPSYIRGKARKLARKRGISPKEALIELTGDRYKHSEDTGAPEPNDCSLRPTTGNPKASKSFVLDPNSYIRSDTGKCFYCGLILKKSQMKEHIINEHKVRNIIRKSLVRLPVFRGIIDTTKWRVLDERNRKEDWQDDEDE